MHKHDHHVATSIYVAAKHLVTTIMPLLQKRDYVLLKWYYNIAKLDRQASSGPLPIVENVLPA
jgi:hypothetical protein